MDWDALKKGALVSAAEQGRVDVMVTVDKNLRYQKNLAAGRRIAIITLNSLFVDLKSLIPLVPGLLDGLSTVRPGAFVVIDPPG